MKKIIKIAKLELSLMFYSPIAWFVLIIFFIQTGLTFTELLYKYETNQQLERPLSVLTKILFAGEDGILATVQNYLYLYIPLLTMGLMSKETSSGSIKLLYSSPVTIKEIILGKYLSMMVYNLFLAAILSSFIIVGMFTIEALDIKFVFGGILGVYLLMCAYAAIGLFMSCLTNYQVVAAISTLALLAFLNFIGGIGQTYDFIREITYWLSINGRANSFVNGLIGTKDIIYFVLVICLFLMLSIFKLNNERTTKNITSKVFSYSILVFVVVSLGYVTSLPSINKYTDTTRFKDRTLTKTSQDLIKKLEYPVHITTYVNIIHNSAQFGVPENRIKDLNSFEMYRRFIPNLTMDYVYYYDTIPYIDTTKTLVELAKNAAKVHHINFDKVWSPDKIAQQIDLKKENNRLVRFVEYGDQTIPLRMFDDIYVYPNEKDISSTLKRLIQKPALVGILTGHGERDVYKNGDDSYKFIAKGVNVRGSLINSGFDVVDVNFTNMDSISKSLDVLVLADPKHAYSEKELQSIHTYISRGGNMLISGEPGKQDVLNPVLDTFGVEFLDGVLLQESENFELDLIQSQFTEQETLSQFKFYKDAIVVNPKAMGIAYTDSTDFEITPILVSNKENTWNKMPPFDLNTQKIVFDSVSEKRIQVPIIMALTRMVKDSINQKIIISGDADFMTNAQANRNTPRNVNMPLALRFFKWFSNNEYAVSTGRPKAIDTRIKINRDGIFWLKIILLGIVPITIAAFGISILIKRHQN
ncbi:ABC transporter [Pseudalgibacter alginicilyticus]|uniref:ABC transporter n=1 Tax=Pseudalgibacter alginicilyticus TaxID=1736674 RepID=A0A0P0CUA9_9FLAO|nr:Gldg family protein [Pseudalgibacter alginicilyticus]ALJ06500.1 ABC transporter [Pseudalgibacter alginicilyticus]